MSSPKSSMPPPSTPAPKDSPFINFANNLSPIQVISNKSNNQVFDSIDVPSPQPVFATPQHRLTDSKLLKRSQTLAIPGPQRNCLGDADHAATSSTYPYMIRQSVTMPAAQSSSCSDKKYSSCNDKKYNNDCHPQDHLCNSPSSCSTCIDAFLAIPFEDCGNTSCSPGSFPGEADDLIKDKEINPVSSSGDQIARPNEDSVQVPQIKSSVMDANSMGECTEHSEKSMATNYIGESTEHSEIANMPNMDPNKVVLPHALQKNSAIYKVADNKFLVSNAGECSDPNVAAGQNASCQAETYPVGQKPLTVSAAFEEIEVKGGLLGKKPGLVCKNIHINSDSFAPSVSCIHHDHISLDKEGSDHFCVPNSMDCRILGHGVECSQTSNSYLPRRQDARLHSYRKGCCDQLYCTTGVKSGSIRNILLQNNDLDISGQMTDASAMHRALSDQEDAAHHHRAMCKRLQFEDCEQQEPSIGYNDNFMSFGLPHSISETTRMPLNMDSQHDSNTNLITTTSRSEPIQPLSGNMSGNCFVEADNSMQKKGRFTAMVPRSSGIGLHLNAIGSTRLVSNLFNPKPMEDICLRGQPFFHGSCQVTLNNMMASRNVSGLISVHLASNCNDSPLDSTQDCHSPIEKKPLDMSLQLKFSDHHITACRRKQLLSEGAGKSEESIQTSLGKKRKKASDVEGQKHCNCRRSKCLKLYCDCFAAGESCNEACSCQGCFNNPDHDEMVSQAKQQIQARNPLAFAPKVVHANDPKENGDNKHITPPSARHKRGCNCKKSKCLKKYCECYQAGVGCFLACRCEGCQNAYGKKGAYGDISDKVVHKRPMEDVHNGESSAEILEIREVSGEVSSGKEINSRISFSTPLAQGTNENDAALSARCLSSSNNGAGLQSDESPTSTMNLASCSAHAEENDQPLSVAPYNQQFDYTVASKLDFQSTGLNEFPDVCNVTPLPESLCRSSSSTIELAKLSQKKLWQYRDTPSSDSLHQCSSVTLHFCEGKYVNEPAPSGLTYNVADETPEILKDTNSPKSLKASSPHQKRVSPPQKLLHEAGSSTSSGLKGARKIILHSIPQFPPLTPYRNNLKEGNGVLSENKGGT